MRGGSRVRHQEEEEESAFISMTDMTVSFLFIVMLLLAFFASQYSENDTVARAIYENVLSERDAAFVEIEILQKKISEQITIAEQQSTYIENLQKSALEEKKLLNRLSVEIEEYKKQIVNLRREIEQNKKRIIDLQEIIEKSKKVDPLETYLIRTAAERRRILEVLRDNLKLDFPDLQVFISEESDALRFQGEGLFDRGISTLKANRKAVVERIAARLQQILPCYTLGPISTWNEGCNPSAAIIEALQIEGHTDSDGLPERNLDLSTARANSTFTTMIASEPQLVAFHNFRGQPVLSVAGYGQMRPIETNETVEGKAANRRVDLRIIMYSPSRSAEIERIRNALERSSEAIDGAP